MENIVNFNDSLANDYFIYKYNFFLESEGKSKLTIKEYINCIKHFLNFMEVSIDEIDQLHIINYQSELQDKQKLASITINKKLYVIKSFLSWLNNNKYITKDVSRKIKTIKIRSQRVAPKSLTDKEINLILQFCGTSKSSVRLRNYAMVQLMLNTGLRISELVALNYSDIIINERSGGIIIRHGKDNKQRTVLLNAKVRSALTRYFEYRINKFKTDISSDSPAIASQSEKRMSIRGIQSVIQELAIKAKITRIKVTPHVLRHTFATRYQDKTKDLVG